LDLPTSSGEVSVGVKMLDCDHRVLFEAIKELQAAASADGDLRRTRSLLRKLADFTLTHFALEEGMMLATKFPGMAQHRLHHQQLTEHVAALASRNNRNGLPLDSEAMNLLSELHVNHVRSDDMHYGLWLNAIGKP
jgi:hemerythrin